MANNSYTSRTTEGVVSSGTADLVSFVRLYLSNPDLVERFQNDWPLNSAINAEYFWDASKGDECYHTFKPYQPTSGKPKHVRTVKSPAATTRSTSQRPSVSAAIENYNFFTPLQLADGLVLKKRIVYGPTRARSDPVSHVPLGATFSTTSSARARA